MSEFKECSGSLFFLFGNRVIWFCLQSPYTRHRF